MRLILFDIDGTLINTRGAGGAALRAAFQETFDVTEPGVVPFSGRTDRGIIHKMFALHGIEKTAENWRRLCAAYLSLLPGYLEARAGCVLRGVGELLDELAGVADVQLGLLTGNLRRGALLKLEHFQLHSHFAFGGYGDDHEKRDDVARAALTAAAEHGARSEWHSTWVVGDTPLDIRCARAIGAQVLAVATGIHSYAELSELGADVLLEDLSSGEHVLRTLLS